MCVTLIHWALIERVCVRETLILGTRSLFTESKCVCDTHSLGTHSLYMRGSFVRDDSFTYSLIIHESVRVCVTHALDTYSPTNLVREWIMSRMWMSHVTNVNESCHACEWVLSRMWMSHESIHTCEWVMSHTWMNRAWVLIHPQTWQVHDFKCVTCLTGVTHSNEWHDSFAFVTWFIHMCNTIHSHEWHDSSTGATRVRLCAHRYLVKSMRV